jgi:hypothetical protein
MLIVTGTRINDISILMIENSERPAGQCNFPNCNSRAVHGGYCIGHAKMMGTPKPDKAKKPIAKKSEKLTQETKEYKKLSAEFLKRPENQICKIKMEGCTIRATQVHHSAGRSGKQLTNVEDFIPSCTNCNLKVEIKTLEGKDLGVKKSRLGKINK